MGVPLLDRTSRPRRRSRTLASAFGELATGPDAPTYRRARTSADAPKAPAEIAARAGAMLAIDRIGVPPALLAALKHAASLHNPEFYEKERMRFSTWDTPRFIRCYRETMDQLLLPRGLADKAKAIVAEAGSRLVVVDGSAAPDPIDVTLRAVLTPEQVTATDALTGHDLGMLVAEPGSGKTVVGCAVIARHATPTLVIVDRKPLVEQWRDRLVTHLGLTSRQIGQFGGGRNRATGIVDVAMVQSLARRDDITELTSAYGLVIVDECHHVPAVTFERAVRDIPVRRWLGLTATPYRRDGLQALMAMHCGPVRHKMAPRQGSALRALDLIVHETTHQPAHEGEHIQTIYRGLIEDTDRNRSICDDITTAVAAGRNCLVLTRWTEHLEVIVEMLAAPMSNRSSSTASWARRPERPSPSDWPNLDPTAACSSRPPPASSAKASTAHPSTPCSWPSPSNSKATSSNTSAGSCAPPTPRHTSRSTTTSTPSCPSSPASTTNAAPPTPPSASTSHAPADAARAHPEQRRTHRPTEMHPVGDAIDDLIEEVIVDAYGPYEQLSFVPAGI